MRSASYVRQQLLSDRHFLYNAFAPLTLPDTAELVLVKVGISTVPMKRLVAIHCNSPFPVEFAAFTPAGDMRRAKRIETRILQFHRAQQTRGEWIMLPSTEEAKVAFRECVSRVITEITHQPVVWAKVSKEEIAREVNQSAKQLRTA